MVLSILIAAIIAPGLLGSQESIHQSQSKERREEHRARRCNLIATCIKSSNRSREINGRPVVLRDGKLWIDTGTIDGGPLGHAYAGYYLPYPDSKYEGLVTTIADVAPIMNWVYIDKDTHEVRYGVRLDAQPNLTGPFDCTRQDRRLTFDGWEGWCAVEEVTGLWALYFDMGDNGLKSKVAPGTRVLEVELNRKEKRFQKDDEVRQQDQTTKRAVYAKEDAPVDQPLAAEVLVSKPGVIDNHAGDGGVVNEPYRPLEIPKSIFDDALPMVEPLSFSPDPPKTRPPAYSPTMSAAPDSVLGPSVQRPITPPRHRAPSIPVDPAVFGARSTGTAKMVPPSRRPNAPRESPTPRSSVQRFASRDLNQSPALLTRQRERSASNQSSSLINGPFRSSPSSSAQGSRAPTRQSLARTMTTGKVNQGMSNRISGGGDTNTPTSRGASAAQRRQMAATVGRKTTSALFREIDDLVGQNTSDPSSHARNGR